MGAKEKAIELIDEFYNSDYCHKEHFPNNRYCDCISMSKFQSIESAIICVDQIIYALNVPPIQNDGMLWKSQNEYWIKVKKELNKLKL